MRRRGMTKTLGVIAVAVIAASFVLYAALRPPVGWPVESRRVAHPSGFSIIAPEDWEQHVTQRIDDRGVDSITMVPSKVVGPPGFFKVLRVTETPTQQDLSKRGYTQTTINGKTVWATESAQNATREHTRSVLFQRDDGWFDIVIRRPATESLDSGSWQAYIETFRTEKPRSLTPIFPTTLPATLP